MRKAVRLWGWWFILGLEALGGAGLRWPGDCRRNGGWFGERWALVRGRG